MTYEQALLHLGEAVKPDGLTDFCEYKGYTNGEGRVVLDGSYTIKDLAAIIAYMKRHVSAPTGIEGN
jgi:hypothetical protein